MADGGVTRTLALDAHGKSLSSALLDMEIPDDEMMRADGTDSETDRLLEAPAAAQGTRIEIESRSGGREAAAGCPRTSAENPLREVIEVAGPGLRRVAFVVDVPDVRHVVLLQVDVDALGDADEPVLVAAGKVEQLQLGLRLGRDRARVRRAALCSARRRTRRPTRRCRGARGRS